MNSFSILCSGLTDTRGTGARSKGGAPWPSLSREIKSNVHWGGHEWTCSICEPIHNETLGLRRIRSEASTLPKAFYVAQAFTPGLESYDGFIAPLNGA